MADGTPHLTVMDIYKQPEMRGVYYTLLQMIKALEIRIKKLEDKKPEYVRPLVYGGRV